MEARIPEGQRVYAIGDIHGCFDLLMMLIERIKADNRKRGAAETHIVALGDLVDRGPQSAHVVEYLRGQQTSFATFHVLSGNHETTMLAALAENSRPEDTGWLNYGGRETMQSYGADEETFAASGPELSTAMRIFVPDTHIAFLKSLPDRLAIGDYLFVHAGIRPGIPIDQQDPEDVRWIRNDFLHDDRDHGMVIVHGHTIRDEPEVRPNRIGIDTGAYKSGVLTALGLEAGDRWFLSEGAKHG